jgi:hypothetical protein
VCLLANTNYLYFNWVKNILNNNKCYEDENNKYLLTVYTMNVIVLKTIGNKRQELCGIKDLCMDQVPYFNLNWHKGSKERHRHTNFNAISSTP